MVPTVNALSFEACWVPVVTVTFRAPSVALFATTTSAEAVVASITVTGPNAPVVAPPTETPGPKLAWVVPAVKLVYRVTMVIVWLWPGAPEFALRDKRRGVGGFTVTFTVALL